MAAESVFMLRQTAGSEAPMSCYFNQKQIQEYYTAMINPDIKGSVLVKGMPVVGKNEEVVFLQYFNNPEVCITKTIR